MPCVQDAHLIRVTTAALMEREKAILQMAPFTASSIIFPRTARRCHQLLWQMHAILCVCIPVGGACNTLDVRRLSAHACNRSKPPLRYAVTQAMTCPLPPQIAPTHFLSSASCFLFFFCVGMFRFYTQTHTHIPLAHFGTAPLATANTPTHADTLSTPPPPPPRPTSPQLFSS